jgi:hypothetical protein
MLARFRSPALALAVLVTACGGYLIDAGPLGIRYQLVEVRGQSPPLLLDSTDLGAEYVANWILDGELVLWPDSTAALVALMRRHIPIQDTVLTLGGTGLYYRVVGDSIFLCMLPPETYGIQHCDRGPYSDTAIVLPLYPQYAVTGRYTRD